MERDEWYIIGDASVLQYATKEEREAELMHYPFLYESYKRNMQSAMDKEIESLFAKTTATTSTTCKDCDESLTIETLKKAIELIDPPKTQILRQIDRAIVDVLTPQLAEMLQDAGIDDILCLTSMDIGITELHTNYGPLKIKVSPYLPDNQLWLFSNPFRCKKGICV